MNCDVRGSELRGFGLICGGIRAATLQYPRATVTVGTIHAPMVAAARVGGA
jgi:hypothetical protein